MFETRQGYVCVYLCRLNRGGGGDAAEYEYRYPMDHDARGRFIVINNRKFLPGTNLDERKGTDVDAKSLKDDFTKMGFRVEVHNDQTADQMLQLMISGR